MFLTPEGSSRVRHQQTAKQKSSDVDKVAVEFLKLTKRVGVHRYGLGSYSLRHTFRTIADAPRDQPAAGHITGHADPGMRAHCVERIEDERLGAVADHARRWLWPPCSPSVCRWPGEDFERQPSRRPAGGLRPVGGAAVPVGTPADRPDTTGTHRGYTPHAPRPAGWNPRESALQRLVRLLDVIPFGRSLPRDIASLALCPSDCDPASRRASFDPAGTPYRDLVGAASGPYRDGPSRRMSAGATPRHLFGRGAAAGGKCGWRP